MFCTKCGQKLDEPSRFCPYCGVEQDAPLPGRQQMPFIEQIPDAPVDNRAYNQYDAILAKPPEKKRNQAALYTIAVLCIIGIGLGALYLLNPGLFSKNTGDADQASSSSPSNHIDEKNLISGDLPKFPSAETSAAPSTEQPASPSAGSPGTEPAESSGTTPVESPAASPEEPPASASPPADLIPEYKREPNVTKRDFIIPDSSYRQLTESELAQYSNVELVIARNEIFARHGYIFGSKVLIKWFSEKSWYVENRQYSGNLLSQVENKNIELLMNYQTKREDGLLAYYGEGSEDIYDYQYFVDSDSRYLSVDEVKDMTKKNLLLAIGELYAHRGVDFSSQNNLWREYYKSFTWYTPVIPESSWDDNMFNEYERENLYLLTYYYEQAED